MYNELEKVLLCKVLVAFCKGSNHFRDKVRPAINVHGFVGNDPANYCDPHASWLGQMPFLDARTF